MYNDKRRFIPKLEFVRLLANAVQHFCIYVLSLAVYVLTGSTCDATELSLYHISHFRWLSVNFTCQNHLTLTLNPNLNFGMWGVHCATSWCTDTTEPRQFRPETLRHHQTGAKVSRHIGTSAKVSARQFCSGTEPSWVDFYQTHFFSQIKANYNHPLRQLLPSPKQIHILRHYGQEIMKTFFPQLKYEHHRKSFTVVVFQEYWLLTFYFRPIIIMIQ